MSTKAKRIRLVFRVECCEFVDGVVTVQLADLTKFKLEVPAYMLEFSETPDLVPGQNLEMLLEIPLVQPKESVAT